MEEVLIPFVHYIPLAPDLSEVADKISWARRHDAVARQIACQATEMIQPRRHVVALDRKQVLELQLLIPRSRALHSGLSLHFWTRPENPMSSAPAIAAAAAAADLRKLLISGKRDPVVAPPQQHVALAPPCSR
mmetsp:Transcript_44417/g.89184  ORF Transcript_44417/g.89184 Transcript_44417/m.89184 type:complete len:133 (+) Transcript_44417:264-662(+)